MKPFQRFLEAEQAGVLLIACAIIALIWANSTWSEEYMALWEVHLRIGFPGFELDKSLHHWINDGLMAIFFFVGLEIKQEILVGELASLRQASLPIAAALGGMLAPAAIYAAMNGGGLGAAGWRIPMATDIAFALGILLEAWHPGCIGDCGSGRRLTRQSHKARMSSDDSTLHHDLCTVGQVIR